MQLMTNQSSGNNAEDQLKKLPPLLFARQSSDQAVETEMGLILSRNSSVRELNSITPSTPIILALNIVEITNSW